MYIHVYTVCIYIVCIYMYTVCIFETMGLASISFKQGRQANQDPPKRPPPKNTSKSSKIMKKKISPWPRKAFQIALFRASSPISPVDLVVEGPARRPSQNFTRPGGYFSKKWWILWEIMFFVNSIIFWSIPSSNANQHNTHSTKENTRWYHYRSVKYKLTSNGTLGIV